MFTGFNAVHFAINSDWFERLRILLFHGASVEIPTRNENDTPLHLAIRNKDIKVIKKIVKNCKNKDECFSKINNEGLSPLDIAKDFDEEFYNQLLWIRNFEERITVDVCPPTPIASDELFPTPTPVPSSNSLQNITVIRF